MVESRFALAQIFRDDGFAEENSVLSVCQDPQKTGAKKVMSSSATDVDPEGFSGNSLFRH